LVKNVKEKVLAVVGQAYKDMITKNQINEEQNDEVNNTGTAS
jgi:hypothetical protein